MQMQSRADWLRWRKTGLGGSDMPIVLGHSPWKTPLELYEEKLSDEIDESSSYQTDLGNEAEPKIGSLFSFMKKIDFQPALVQMEDFTYMKSSLDGYSPDKTAILEIKLSGKDDFETVSNGKVPEKYYPQCQHNLLVSGAKVCYFVVHSFSAYKETRQADPDNMRIVEVYPDKDYHAMLLREAAKFWDHVLKRKPPMPSDRDFKPLVGLSKEAKRWKVLKQKIKELEIELEQIEEKIKLHATAAQHPRLLCAGIKLTQVAKQGNVQYAKIPELKGVDLDKYRSNGSIYWKLTETGE